MKRSGRLLRFGVPILIGVLVLTVAIARVGAGDPHEPGNGSPPAGERRVEPVTIETINVNIAESHPVQVFVDVAGYLPDPCWEAPETVVTEAEPRFEVEIMAERDPGETCAQVIEDYQATIPLGSPEPGDYVVDVNGVEQAFEVH